MGNSADFAIIYKPLGGINMENSGDFVVTYKPYEIHLKCPFCKIEIKIPWIDVNAPEQWKDDWGYIDCPFCKNEIKLNKLDGIKMIK